MALTDEKNDLQVELETCASINGERVIHNSSGFSGLPLMTNVLLQVATCSSFLVNRVFEHGKAYIKKQNQPNK